tara:strand:- start:755 stop:1366 length:612 start_codon:yes stop_codon:yes gene_type:complete
MPIHQLFPIPVDFSKLDRVLTPKELREINEHKKKTYKNEGNRTSNDSYILERKSLKNLKKDLNKKVTNYFNKIICSPNSLLPYITQSWINYTEKNQFHHQHSHSNSYVSGVFYIDANKKVDKIKFFKSGYSPFKLPPTQFNVFNSSTWWYPVESGDVILFPSSLEHGVDRKEGTNIRTSLSFNIFFKGTIGNSDDLTELILKK